VIVYPYGDGKNLDEGAISNLSISIGRSSWSTGSEGVHKTIGSEGGHPRMQTYSKRYQCGDQHDGRQLFSNPDSHGDHLSQDGNPDPPMSHALCMCTLPTLALDVMGGKGSTQRARRIAQAIGKKDCSLPGAMGASLGVEAVVERPDRVTNAARMEGGKCGCRKKYSASS
jgi:hypothetical protein